jgi:hypothetical protein
LGYICGPYIIERFCSPITRKVQVDQAVYESEVLNCYSHCFRRTYVCCFELVGQRAWNPSTDDEKLIGGNDKAYLDLVEKYGENAVQERLQFLSARFERNSQINDVLGVTFQNA